MFILGKLPVAKKEFPLKRWSKGLHVYSAYASKYKHPVYCKGLTEYFNIFTSYLVFIALINGTDRNADISMITGSQDRVRLVFFKG